MPNVNYTNIASIKDYWIENIAPNYIDVENTNMYHAGLLGMILEIMSESVEDSFEAMNVIRREFYPSTMQFQSTMFKMAPLYRLDIPVASPSTASCLLLLEQKQIIERSTFDNGMYKFVLDNTMQIMAADIPFLLDFPIVILSKPKDDGYIFTSHYELDYKNSLSQSDNKFIPNVEIIGNGIKYLVLTVTVRQCTMVTETKPIKKDVLLNTVNMEFPFDGKLANFEIFYKESDNSEEIRLEKVLKNGFEVTSPFCFYEMVNSNKIRLIFKKNLYFNPIFNSTIRIEIYTTLGKDGTFPICKSDLVCIMKSTKYPNNNNMMITGKINGGTYGGYDALTMDEFGNMIKMAYSTNNTLTTSNDIQQYFLYISNSNRELNNCKLSFEKSRDDVFIRLWGSYALMRDNCNNIIPTNTVSLDVRSGSVLRSNEANSNLYILPGTLISYKPDSPDSKEYGCTVLYDNTICDNIDELENQYGAIFTIPYLVSVSIDQSLVGFYLNSVNLKRDLLYLYVNDKSKMQFIAYNIHIYRNSILGDSFYTISLECLPASPIEVSDIIDIPIEDETSIIRASENGYYAGSAYDGERIFAKFIYDDGDMLELPINSYIDQDSKISSGYDIKFNIGSRVVKGDIIAKKKVCDKLTVRAILDFKGVLIDNEHYIPLYIEEYDSENNSYTFRGYFGTDDMITRRSTVNITNGIYDKNGAHDENITIPMGNLMPEVHIFYNNTDANFVHGMENIKYTEGLTLTNTYSMNTVMGYLNIIQQVDYIRSTVSFIPGEESTDFIIDIDEVPVVGAKWIKEINNFEYCVNKLSNIYSALQNTIHPLLENGYSIDMKFYNTYGKSRFFKVGIANTSEDLDTVNCSLRFGLCLNSISNTDTILTKIREYIKQQIESINNTNKYQNIYIMNLIYSCKQEFPEISYMEWYGVNSYDYGIQKIECVNDISTQSPKFIPEFININSILLSSGVSIPDINLKLLNKDGSM